MADNEKIKRLAERLTGPDPAAGEAAQEEVDSLTDAEREVLTSLLAQHAAHAADLQEDDSAGEEVIDRESEDGELAQAYREAQAAQLFHCFEKSVGRPPATAEEATEWAALHPEELPLDEQGKVVPRFPEAD
jgi:hypothetical protein